MPFDSGRWYHPEPFTQLEFWVHKRKDQVDGTGTVGSRNTERPILGHAHRLARPGHSVNIWFASVHLVADQLQRTLHVALQLIVVDRVVGDHRRVLTVMVTARITVDFIKICVVRMEAVPFACVPDNA